VKRKLAAVAVAAGILLAVTGCSHGPDRGYIKEKSYTPAYATTTTSCSGTKEYRVCTPITTWHSESYEFDLYSRKWDQDEPHGWVEVDPQTYAKYHEGDFVDLK